MNSINRKSTERKILSYKIFGTLFKRIFENLFRCWQSFGFLHTRVKGSPWFLFQFSFFTQKCFHLFSLADIEHSSFLLSIFWSGSFHIYQNTSGKTNRWFYFRFSGFIKLYAPSFNCYLYQLRFVHHFWDDWFIWQNLTGS